MAETNLTFTSGSTELAGTFTTPDTGNPHHTTPYPTVLFIAGSGPLDRNGDHGKLAINVSGLLAAELAAHGWASMRYDKRGIGASGGEYLPTGFYDELADVEAAVDHLRGYDDVGRIVLIGHSAGAVQAAEMAARHADLAGAVLLSTSAKIGGDTMRWQTKELADVLVPKPIKALLKLFRTSVVKQQANNLAKLEATEGDVARIQFVKVNAKWMREFIAHDPRPGLREAKVPLLAITGGKDVQVDPSDIETILAIAPAGTEGYVIPDVDHILRHEPADFSNPRLYKNQVSKPLDARVTAAVIDWLLALPATSLSERTEA